MSTGSPLNRAERTIVWIFRVVGVSGLFAIPAVFLPTAVMDRIHALLGLGTLPQGAIVEYLTRSLSAFYAFVSVLMLETSRDVRRYAQLVRVWSLLIVVLGCVLTGIDFVAGLPVSWILLEGPPTILVGVWLFVLQKRITLPSGDVITRP